MPQEVFHCQFVNAKQAEEETNRPPSPPIWCLKRLFCVIVSSPGRENGEGIDDQEATLHLTLAVLKNVILLFLTASI